MRPASPAAAIRRRLVQSTALAALLVAVPSIAQVAPDALPRGEDRSDLVSRSGSAMTVTLNPAEPRSVINWASYDIGDAASVRYTNRAGVDIAPVAVLNRVIGEVNDSGRTTITASNILGSLTSENNISVFLVNPAGILFGQNATVAVGSLIASTRDIEPRAFLTAVRNEYRFIGPSEVPDADDPVLVGDQAITAGSIAPLGFKANDVVALIAARVMTRNTINAGREVAIVAADDTTLTLNPGSPLQIRIDAGTSIKTPMLLRGTLNGGSVMVAAATRTGLTKGLLDIDATMEASSATASDQGIILSAGRTGELNDSIVMLANSATGDAAKNDGELGILLGGELRATGVAGTIDVRAKNGIAGQRSRGSVATLTAAQGIYVHADAAISPEDGSEPVGVALGAVSSGLISTTVAGVDISAGAGSVFVDAVTAGTAGASVVAGAGTVALDSLFAAEAATISGTAVTVAGEARSEGGALTVTVTDGSITADGLRSNGPLQATASKGNLVVDSLTSDGGTVRVRAIDVLGNTTPGTRASLDAGQNVDLVATGSATLGTVNGRTIDVRAGGFLSATGMSASAGPPTGDGLYATAATIDVGTANATGSTARLIATGGAASVTSLNAGVDGVLSSSGQATLRGGGIVGRDLLVSGTQVRLGTAGGGGGTQQAGRNAVYNASTGTIAGIANDTGLTIRANASSGGAGSIVLDANTGIDLTGITLSTGDPAGSAPIGNVGIRLATAAAPLTLGATDANALLSVDAGHTIFSTLATDGAVTLGTTRLIDRLALSTPGTIRLAGVTIFGDGEALSVTGTGAATTVTATGTLSAPGGVSVTAPGLVSLASVAAGDGTAAIESTGAGLSAGAVSGGIVTARARGALLLGSVTAAPGAATLTSVTAGITVNNATLAAGDVTVDAPGAIRMGAVRSTGGTVLFRSTTVPVFGTIDAGAVQARMNLTVSRDAGITFAGARSETGAVTLTAANGAVVVNGPTIAATTASLTGRSLTLGAVTAGANVTLDSPGVIRAGDVRSTGGTVVFRSTATPVTGAVIADAVSADGDLIVSRDPGVSFASATSTNGRVSLTSSGIVAVSGATVAGTSVTVAGRDATLGSVTARNGSVDLSAGVGALGTGPLLATGSIRAVANTTATIAGSASAGGYLQASGNTGLTLGSAASSNDRVELVSSAGSVDVAGAVTARNFVTVDARTDARLGSVTDTGTGASVLRARSGTLVVSGATSVGGLLTVEGAAGVGLGATASTGGSVTIASANGAIAATTIDAAAGVDVRGQGTLTLGDVTARGGSVVLVSRAAAVTADLVTARTTLNADAATTLAIARAIVGTDATLGGREVALGDIEAGTLAVTARGGDLTLTAGDIRGSATLTKTGVGAISVGRLSAAGSIGITSDAAVRADLLEGGATTVTAVGDVSGRTGGLAASVASLAVGAGGTATIAAVTTTGDTSVSATGATRLAGAVSTGGDLLASGSSVTLGSGGPVAQTAAGRIDVTSTAGPIAGLGGLTLRSDIVGAGGRDLTLRSAAGIEFAGDTLIAGGSARQSAVRLSAGTGTAISLGTVEARTIASPGTDTVLNHGGPLSIARVATQDSLAIVLNGTASTLTLGPVDVSAGDLSLDTSGALTAGAITALGLSAIARGGSATFSTIDASAGGITATAATDLRLTRATATGAIALTSIAGDVTGNARSGGFAPAVLASGGDTVSVRADATDGGRGIVLLDTVAGAGGIDLSGRTIIAESLTSSGGGVIARTRRDSAGITDQRMALGTVRAAGSILLETGNASAISDGTLALDRATSTGGDIAITTIGGGLAARNVSPRSILSAPAGTITLDIGGPAVLGAASGRATTIAATSLDVTTAEAGAGALALTARRGPLSLGTGRASGSVTLTATGDLLADRLTAGAALTATGDSVTVATLSTGGDARVTGTTRVAITSVTAPGTLTVAGRTISVAEATLGALDATAGAGGFDLRTGTVTGAARVVSGAALTFGTLDAGAVDIRATGEVTADLLTARGGLNITAASARITATRVSGGATRIATGTGGLALSGLVATGDLDASTTGVLTAGTLDVGGRMTASGASATIGQAMARGGDLGVTATGGDIRLGSVTASGAVGLASSGASAVTGAVSAGGGYRIDAASIALGATGATTRQAASDVTLTARTGGISAQGSTTLAATRSVALTANGTNGTIGFAPETAITAGSGDIALATRGAAALGTVTASAGAIRLDAADAALTRPLSARTVTLTNVASTGITRLGDTGVGNEGEFGTAATRFDLNNTEVGLIAAPTVTIAGGARDVVVGALTLNAATGSTRFAITADGRVDMLGRFVAADSSATRTIAIGNEASGTSPRTGVIRVAATPAEGGRLLVDGAALELTADRIGVGFDRDFLDAIGYRATGLGVEQVTREYVARPTSTLYNAGGLGAPPYTDTVLVRSATLGLTYGRYALIQNTGRPGEQRGVVIGTTGGTGADGPTVRLAAPGSSANTFSLFGTIDGINSTAAALLGPDRLFVDPSISPVASRINGCVIGSGAGCLNTSIAQPSINLFDTSRAEIVRTADDLSLPFDPLIGTNNEALYLDPADEPGPPDCEGDKPCPPKP